MNPEEMQETPEQAIAKYTTDFTKLASEGNWTRLLDATKKSAAPSRFYRVEPRIIRYLLGTRGLAKRQSSKDWRNALFRVTFRKTCKIKNYCRWIWGR